MKGFLEDARFFAADTLLNKAYDFYFKDLEPKTIISYLPQHLTHHVAFFLAEKVSKSARRGMRRSANQESQSAFNNWESLATDAAEILLDQSLPKRRNI